jgi:hypothetical protein
MVDGRFSRTGHPNIMCLHAQDANCPDGMQNGDCAKRTRCNVMQPESAAADIVIQLIVAESHNFFQNSSNGDRAPDSQQADSTH